MEMITKVPAMRGWPRYDGFVGLMKRYSENCWPSTPPPLLVFSSKLLLRSWAITCIVVTLQYPFKGNLGQKEFTQ